MEAMKFNELCADCMFYIEHPAVCALCFGGKNYMSKVSIGPTRINLDEYKEVFRYHRWIDMFSASHVYDVVKKLLIDKPTNEKLKLSEKIHRTVVKTKSLLHEQLYGKGAITEEFLYEDDEYYFFRYRNVMYMIHKHKTNIYVKALLDWHDINYSKAVKE